MVSLQTGELRLQEYVDTPFKVDRDLQANPETTGKKCMDAFLEKGGILHVLHPEKEDKFALLPGDAVFPSCSGGFNRSQTLWMLLSSFAKDILLFPPHATRMGYDPYNDRINWHKNVVAESKPDEFEAFFKQKKVARFGFDRFDHLKEKTEVAAETIREIWDFYNAHYFGKESLPKDGLEQRRVYITFAGNTHVHLRRLFMANEKLSDVTLVSIDMEDLVGHPLPEWQAAPLSQTAYAKVLEIIRNFFDFSKLRQDEV